MEQTLNPRLAERRVVARIRVARVLQVIGWSGVAGLLMLLASAGIVYGAWTKRAEAKVSLEELRIARSMPVVVTQPDLPAMPVLPRLPRHDDIPLILTRMERAASTNGLPWAAADYRLVPAAGPEAPALEVSFGFKAPYPKVRAMLADLVGSVPAVAVREMSMTRSSVESADVDTKFTVAIFLADDTAVRETASDPATPR